MAKTETRVLGTSWEELAGGDRTIAVQPTGQGQFRIAILASPAEPTAETRGLVFSSTVEGLPGEFSAAGLPDGARVFGRSFNEAPCEVTVMTY